MARHAQPHLTLTRLRHLLNEGIAEAFLVCLREQQRQAVPLWNHWALRRRVQAACDQFLIELWAVLTPSMRRPSDWSIYDGH